jgi:glutamate--cysteine ligase
MDVNGAVERLFAPARRPGRVGAEAELVGDRHRAAAVDRRAAGFDAGSSGRWPRPSNPAASSKRPGAPADRRTLARDLDWMLRRAAAILRRAASGWRPPGSTVPLLRGCSAAAPPRYLAMQRVFDETGPDGRRMMRLTASLQITIDLLPGRAGQEQWLVANLAGPPLAAAFANSGTAEGRPAGIEGARTQIWQNVDLRRTGYDGRHLDLLDPVGAYAAFAAAAPQLRIPEAERPSYHLSTLFPPVRPRGGYLEVRYLDAQPPQRIVEAVATVAALLCDPQARHDALDLLLPRAGDQQRAWTEATTGFSPEAGALLSIARAARHADAPALVSGGVS